MTNHKSVKYIKHILAHDFKPFYVMRDMKNPLYAHSLIGALKKGVLL